MAGIGLAACREAQRQHAAAPEYCRYAQVGPVCDAFDPAAIPYPVALGLRPLRIVDGTDRALLDAYAAGLTPRPRAVRVLAPVGPVPEGRRPYDRALPQRFARPGTLRLVLLALTPPDAAGRIDVHSVILDERQVVASERLAQGLREAGLRGEAALGRFELGFSLTDQPGSVGDLYRLRPRGPGFDANAPDVRWAANLGWTRLAADARERRLDWFRSITNGSSCADSGAPMTLLLAPRPQAWLDEYIAACRVRPQLPEFQPRAPPGREDRAAGRP